MSVRHLTMRVLDRVLALILLAFYSSLSTRTAESASTIQGYVSVSSVPAITVYSFDSTVKAIVRSISQGFEDIDRYSQLTVGFLTASNPFPSRYSFQNFARGNRFFDPNNVIKWIEWVPQLANNERTQFEAKVRTEIPDFNIFLFGGPDSSTKVVLGDNASTEYGPIDYLSPITDNGIQGLDLYNDATEGPTIRRIRSTGRAASAHPFLLRGLSSENIFKMGMTTYIPIFRTNSSTLTSDFTKEYAGCVVTVLHFHPLLKSVLKPLNLSNIDVFLFALDAVTNQTRLVGHIESGPTDTMPNITPEDELLLQPHQITGDIVTDFDGVLAEQLSMQVVEQRLRVLVRARAGSLPRDVLVFNSFGQRCTKMQQYADILCGQCSEVVQGSTFSLTVADAQRRVITFTMGGSGSGIVCLPKASPVCNITFLGVKAGAHVLEIFAGGEQISDSPVLASITVRPCSEGHQVSLEDGRCICPAEALVISGSCVALSTVAISIVFGVVFLAGSVFLFRYMRMNRDSTLLSRMASLRKELKITPAHGFILSTEWYPWWWTGCFSGYAVVIQTKYMESAARLALFREDFDVRFFDSLSACFSDKPQQYQYLGNWLLHVSQALLDPIEDLDEHKSPNSFEHIRTTFLGITSITKISRSESLSFEEMRACELGTADKRFDYFRAKVSKVRMWRDEDGLLFKELKDVAQRLMDKMAQHYDRRFEEFCQEAGGIKMCTMASDIVHASSALDSTVNRQDHPEVLAVRVDDMSEKEGIVRAKSLSKASILQLEELFFCQLWLRAQLLDDMLYQRVHEVLQRHTDSYDSRSVPYNTKSGRPHITVRCCFEEGLADVELHSAPIKTIARMREKVAEYDFPEAAWPLSANILDPVRVSIVCQGPSQVMQMLAWFRDDEGRTQLPVCRIKNKFASQGGDVQHGYRDLKIFVIVRDLDGLAIIGEIQIHDRMFHNYKHKTHKLYTIVRAQSLDAI